MVYRLSWIAGLAGIGLALARATRLLRPSVDGLSWQVILVASALLGAAITWAAVGYRLRGVTIFAVNLVAVTLTVIRVAVPQTTWFIFPTLDSFTALGTEIGFARDVIRSGHAPVIPLAGIVAILAVVFWGMGALLTWGLRSGRPYVAVLTPLVVYLEFSVMDRRPSGWWTTTFMVVIGLALIAVAMDRRREGTGLLVSTYTRRALIRSLPSIGVVTLTITLVVALFTADALAGFVPRSGLLDWRNSSSLSGEFFGSVSYNPFVGIRQQLISQTNVPVFVAEVEGEVAPNRVYWRLITLDSFDGSQWYIGGRPAIERSEDLERWEAEEVAFEGDTASVTADVTILALQQDWLPAPYAPTGLAAQNRGVERGYRVRTDDASLRFDALTYRGMTYTVASEVPRPDLDVLSRLPDGSPSPVFAGAIESEGLEIDAVPLDSLVPRELPDRQQYLELPEGIDVGVRSLARSLTENLQTDYERALALEAFFRTPGNFRYSTSILPGHGAEDLSLWLLDPDSPNFRTGYCEQFATSMAVMARQLGIPSRVVLGFTPGTLLEDGRVVVRDRNAHAWVELWMPTQGWVRFDPTPRGDEVNPPTTDDLPFDVSAYLDVPEREQPAAEDSAPEPVLLRDEPDVPRVVATGGGEDPTTAPQLPGWLLPVALGAAALFGMLPGIKWLRRRRRMRRLSDGDVAAAWSEIVDRLSDLGDAPHPATTPLEVARATDTAMRPLAEVYAEVAYGPDAIPAARVAVAARSLEDTEDRLISRYSLGRRIWSQYRLTSLVPQWWRQRRHRRR